MKLAKRISIVLLAACVIGGSAFAVSACGSAPETGSPASSDTAALGKDDDSIITDSGLVSQIDTNVVTSDAPSASSEGEGSTSSAAPSGTGMQAYLNRDDVQAELKKQISAVNAEGDMRLRVAAEGSNFVYTYTLLHITTEELTVDEIETEFAGVKAELEENHSTFAVLIREIRTDAGVENPAVIVRYETSTGKILYELTFTETDVLQTVPAA